MNSPLVTELTEQIGAYGIQCSETKELAPTTQLSDAIKAVDIHIAALEKTISIRHEIIEELQERIRNGDKKV